MIAPTRDVAPGSPSTTKVRAANRDARELVAACGRGDVAVRQTSRWPVYLVCGREQPDARPVLVKFLNDGVLQIADPDAVESLVLPADMIGA